MLTEADVVELLLELRLVSTFDVVSGGLVVDDFSRRNRNFAVRTRDGSGYLFKQSDIRRSSQALQREADIYRLLWTHEIDFARRHMPEMRHGDESGAILIADYLAGAEPLSTAPLPAGARDEDGAIELGRTLARLHEPTRAERCDLEAPTPWVLSVCAPNRDPLAELSAGSISAIRIIQQSSLVEQCLGDLSRSGSRRTLIHGDMRLDNCLIRLRGNGEPASLFLVDWELAGVGDPSWDVGTVLCEYLSMWVRSFPVAPALSLQDSLGLALRPLGTVLPSLLAFWEAYRQESSCWDGEPEFLVRSVQSAGARLLQSAIESAQMSAELTGTVVYVVQLAENLLAEPRSAGARLMGLPIR